MLRETNSGRMEIVKIGESLNDFKLVQVLPYAISFEKGGQLYRLFYHRPLREEMKSSGSRIKKELVYKTVLERLRSEWNLIFQKTEVIPYKLRNGVQGYKILKLPTNCYLSEIGIRENDIIFQINDIKLDESANFNSLYESLKDCRKFEINALRNGKLYNLVFSMK